MPIKNNVVLDRISNKHTNGQTKNWIRKMNKRKLFVLFSFSFDTNIACTRTVNT